MMSWQRWQTHCCCCTRAAEQRWVQAGVLDALVLLLLLQESDLVGLWQAVC
jgi:hypothetical protein